MSYLAFLERYEKFWRSYAPYLRMVDEMARIKKTGQYKGKSNALGHGGRAAQLKDAGVPDAVIGQLARKAQAAPGMKNYHGRKR